MGIISEVIDRLRTPSGSIPDLSPEVAEAEAVVAATQRRLNELKNERRELGARVADLGTQIGRMTSADRGAAYLDGQPISVASLREEARRVQEQLGHVEAAIPIQEARHGEAVRKMGVLVSTELRPVYRRLLVELASSMKKSMAAAKAEKDFRDALIERGVPIGHLFPTPYPGDMLLPQRWAGGKTIGWIDSLERDHGIRLEDL